ncbi:MAG: hypothetical protein P1U61_03355 [Legionellaceae bacterium]|nr:hypothetical protein [Legionellaceae bacterium]
MSGNDLSNESNQKFNPKVLIKPKPKRSMTSLSCTIFGESNSKDVLNLTKSPFTIKLTPEKKLEECVTSSNTNVCFFHSQCVSGTYAFCLVEATDNCPMSGKKAQYLLLKTLDNGNSNHSVLSSFLRLGKFSNAFRDGHIICGGEIQFNQGVIIAWNLKSGGYSVHTEFDEIENIHFKNACEKLWLPNDLYTSIKSSIATDSDKIDSDKSNVTELSTTMTFSSSVDTLISTASI